MAMNKEEFQKQFCENSRMSVEEYNEYLITLPCTCDGEDCKGWAAITNNVLSIKHHNFLYNHEHETYRGRNEK